MATGNYHITFNRMSLEGENGQNLELPILAIDSTNVICLSRASLG
jgi:hypothetical protein